MPPIKQFGTKREVCKGIAQYPVYGSRLEVWHGRAEMTTGGLTKDDIYPKGPRKFVSVRKVEAIANNAAMMRNADRLRCLMR